MRTKRIEDREKFLNKARSVYKTAVYILEFGDSYPHVEDGKVEFRYMVTYRYSLKFIDDDGKVTEWFFDESFKPDDIVEARGFGTIDTPNRLRDQLVEEGLPIRDRRL